MYIYLAVFYLYLCSSSLTSEVNASSAFFLTICVIGKVENDHQDVDVLLVWVICLPGQQDGLCKHSGVYSSANEISSAFNSTHTYTAGLTPAAPFCLFIFKRTCSLWNSQTYLDKHTNTHTQEWKSGLIRLHVSVSLIYQRTVDFSGAPLISVCQTLTTLLCWSLENAHTQWNTVFLLWTSLCFWNMLSKINLTTCHFECFKSV